MVKEVVGYVDRRPSGIIGHSQLEEVCAFDGSVVCIGITAAIDNESVAYSKE